MLPGRPFATNLVAGLSNELNINCFGLLLYIVRLGKLGESSLIRQSEVDAICLNSSGECPVRQATMELASGLKQSLVVIQGSPVDTIRDIYFVRRYDEGGAALLAAEVMKWPCRRAATVIADIPWPAVEHSIAGFKRVFDQHDVQLDFIRCDETSSWAITNSIADDLDRRRVPDVLVGQNDQIAIAGMYLLASRGLDVPTTSP